MTSEPIEGDVPQESDSRVEVCLQKAYCGVLSGAQGKGQVKLQCSFIRRGLSGRPPWSKGGGVWSGGGKEAGLWDSRFIQSLDAVLRLGYELQPRASPQEGLR